MFSIGLALAAVGYIIGSSLFNPLKELRGESQSKAFYVWSLTLVVGLILIIISLCIKAWYALP